LRYANRAHIAMFGGQSGDDASAGVVPADVRQAAAEVLTTGQSVRTDLPVGDQYVHTVCTPVRHGEEITGASVVSVDITHQVRARRHVELRHQRLTVLDEATSAVAAETDPHRELVALAESVVPSLADACAVYLVDQSRAAASRTGALA